MKSIKRRSVLLGMAAGVTAGVIGIPAIGRAATKARLGHAFTDEHPRGVAMRHFAEAVDKATNGEVKITVYPGSVLGSEQQMLQATQSGSQQIYLGAVSPLAGKKSEFNIFDFPFLFSTNEEAAQVLDSAVGRRMLDDLSDLNLHGLEWSGGAFRNIANNAHPVKRMEELQGLKLRVMPAKVAIDSFKALGVNAVPMAYTEVYTALETGAIDGHEHPLVDMLQNKMYEVEKYLTISNHVYTPVALIGSKEWFDSLTPEQQAAVKKVAAETKAFQRREEIKQTKEAVDKLSEHGMEVDVLSPADIQKIRDIVNPVIEADSQEIDQDLLKAFRAQVQAARSAG